MRWTACVVGLWLALPGCNVAYYSAFNLVNEPKLETSEYKFRKQTRKVALKIWQSERFNATGFQDNRWYADGFVDGYTDYIVDGGAPRVPAIPPPEYRRHVKFFNSVGQDTQRIYLAGFKHGGEYAAAHGCRESTLVTVAVPPNPNETPLTITCIDRTPIEAAPSPASAPAPVPAPVPPPAPTAAPARPMPMPIPPMTMTPKSKNMSASDPNQPAGPRMYSEPLLQLVQAHLVAELEPAPPSDATLWGRIPFSTLAQVPAVSFWGTRR